MKTVVKIKHSTYEFKAWSTRKLNGKHFISFLAW